MATPIETENKRKYLHGPTMDQIDAFIKDCKVSARRFESFFGMPDGTIKVVRSGYMKLPVKYWHIFYEKIVPTYGVGVEVPSKPIVARSEVKKPAVVMPVTPATFSHDRLSKLR